MDLRICQGETDRRNEGVDYLDKGMCRNVVWIMLNNLW
jgi:hypothetical protein